MLNNADSLLSLEGIVTIGGVQATDNASSGKGIQVVESATLGSFDLTATSFLDIAANKTINGPITVQSNGELNISGSGEYLGNMELAGGKFSATDNQTLSGTLSITANSELRVLENYTLVLNQSGGLPLGANTLTLSGGGTLQSSGLELDDTDSKLKLSSIIVSNVITSADSLGLEIDDNSTITSLSISNLSPVSITDGKSLSGSITVNTGGTVQLADNGTIAADISMNGGKLDADESLTISGAVTQAGNATIDVASGKTLTFDNGTISTENYQMTIEGAGTVAFPNGTTWTEQTSGTSNAPELLGVTYGNGTFVTTGRFATIYTSPDGTTWTKQTSGGSTLYEVTYGNGTFVTAGRNGTIFTSTDGTTWTSRTSPIGTSKHLYGVTYGKRYIRDC